MSFKIYNNKSNKYYRNVIRKCHEERTAINLKHENMFNSFIFLKGVSTKSVSAKMLLT